MHLTSRYLISLASFIVLTSMAVAKTNPACLKHLGGGYGDAECYHGLSADITADNDKLYRNLRATIPLGNAHQKLLNDYMASQNDAIKYCELQRNAGAQWKAEHDGSMFPALYEQCVYNIRKTQSTFLQDLLKMANWK